MRLGLELAISIFSDELEFVLLPELTTGDASILELVMVLGEMNPVLVV
jgi:hypothetical protein